MDVQSWIPSVIAVGALGAIWLWLRRAIDDLKDQIKQMNRDIAKIRDEYLEEEKHALICHGNVLEIEKVFKRCNDELKNAFFTKLRELEKKIMEMAISVK